MEEDFSLMKKIDLGADYYWTGRTLWVGPTVLDVLLRVAEQRFPLVGILLIDVDINTPSIYILDVINSCEEIDTFPRKSTYFSIDLGAGGAKYFQKTSAQTRGFSTPFVKREGSR